MSAPRPDNLPETPLPRRRVRCIGGLLRANLKAHLDGEMSALRNGLVRWHLAQCAECREELRWLRRLGEDMKDIESARPRPELRARILANLPKTPPAPGIRVVHSRPDLARSPRRLPRLALASGLAMLLAFSAVFALKRTSGTSVGGTTSGSVVLSPHDNSAQDDASTAEDASVKRVMETITYAPQEDPNNALADKMFHEQMTALEHEKQVQGQDDWHRLLAQARAVARKSEKTPETEMGVALAVSNIAVVRTHLPTWAKQEGVRFVTTGKPALESFGSAPLLSGRAGESLDNLVAFYVPAERGPAFLGALKQLGQISILPLSPRPIPSTNLKTDASVRSELNADGQRKAIPTAPMTADSGAPTDRMTAAHEKHADTARYLVVTVLLQTIAHN